MDPRTSPVQRFFDVSVDMLCLAGTDGYFKTLNQAWSETLGYQDGELLQKPFVDFVHPDDLQATIDAAAKVAGGDKLVSFRNRYRCKDGTYKWLAWTAAPALSDGTIYAAARDVTTEVLAEATGIVQSEEQRARVLAVMEDDRVRAVFQPVVNLANLEVGGYEALSRFDTAPVMPPDQWFEAAHAAGTRPGARDPRHPQGDLACVPAADDGVPVGQRLAADAADRRVQPADDGAARCEPCGRGH